MYTTSMTPEKALAAFGLGCAQHVFGEFAPQFGIDRQTALRIASLFGSGMFEGASCGAVVGALMAIGLKYGQGDDPDPEKQEILLQKGAELAERADFRLPPTQKDVDQILELALKEEAV